MHSVLLKSSSIDSKLVLKFSTTLWIHSLNVTLNKWSQPNQHLYSLVTIFKLHNRTVQHIFLLTSMSTSLIFTTTKPRSEQPHNSSYMKEREAEGVGGREGRGGSESGTFIHVQRLHRSVSFFPISPKDISIALPKCKPSQNRRGACNILVLKEAWNTNKGMF